MTTTRINIAGMTCGHCVGRVKDAISKVDHVIKVDVQLSPGCATIETDNELDLSIVAQAVESVGFSVSR